MGVSLSAMSNEYDQVLAKQTNPLAAMQLYSYATQFTIATILVAVFVVR